MTSITVSIVSHASDATALTQTITCLAASARTMKASVRLIVTDNTDSEADRARLAKLVEQWIRNSTLNGLQGFALRHTGTNLGYGRTNNFALHRCRSEFLLILNPDVELDPSALDMAVQAMQHNPKALLITPRAMAPDGTDLHLNHRYPSVAALLGRGITALSQVGFIRRAVHRYELQDLPLTTAHEQTQCASGCFMLIRTRAWRQVGGFDPRFFMYFEDYDLSARLRQHGAIRYEPAVKLIHLGGQAASKGFRHRWWFVRSAAQFFSRHGWQWH